MSSCSCRPPLHDESGQVLRVETCPLCLLAGSITWLIENGRQLDMFHALAVAPTLSEVDRSVSVSALVEVEGSSMLSIYKTQGLCSCDLPF